MGESVKYLPGLFCQRCAGLHDAGGNLSRVALSVAEAETAKGAKTPSLAEEYDPLEPSPDLTFCEF